MNKIKKRNRLLKKLFFNMLRKTKLEIKNYYITFRICNNTEIGINDDLKMVKVRYNTEQVKYITKHSLCNYYKGRGRKIYNYVKNNYKRARCYAILHELGHFYHYQKYGFERFLNEYESEKMADKFAIKYMKRFKI